MFRHTWLLLYMFIVFVSFRYLKSFNQIKSGFNNLSKSKNMRESECLLVKFVCTSIHLFFNIPKNWTLIKLGYILVLYFSTNGVVFIKACYKSWAYLPSSHISLEGLIRSLSAKSAACADSSLDMYPASASLESSGSWDIPEHHLALPSRYT